MKDEDILDVVLKYRDEWSYEKISAFMQVARKEDTTEEDILRELGMEARR